MTSTTGGNDVSRYGNDGSLGSVLSFAPDIHNEPDGAMYFPGNHSDSMISIPNDANSSLRLNHDSFSVSGFFKPEAGPGGPIFAYWQSGLGNKLWFFGDNDHEVEILVGDEGGGGSEMLKTWWGPIAFLAVGEWTFFTLAYDRAIGKLTAWKNGQLFQEKDVTAGLVHKSSWPIYIGIWT